jgi:CrcB protein
MSEVIFITLAGGLGALGRYYMAGLAQRLLGDGFPFGTLIVNVLGSFLIGLVMQASMSTDLVPRTWRLALTLGFGEHSRLFPLSAMKPSVIFKMELC